MSPNTPGMMRNMNAEIASVQETLSNMSMHRASSQAELERVMASPVNVNTGEDGGQSDGRYAVRYLLEPYKWISLDKLLGAWS